MKAISLIFVMIFVLSLQDKIRQLATSFEDEQKIDITCCNQL